MQCKFVVGIQYGAHKDLISHECFPLEEKIMSCEDERSFEVDFERQSKVKAGLVFFLTFVEFPTH